MHASGNERESMTCAEFQEQLPLLIDAGKLDDHPHLATCHACASLVRDLRYIAEQAKLLLPLRDPDTRVWTNIHGQLEKEGLIKEGRTSGPGPNNFSAKK